MELVRRPVLQEGVTSVSVGILYHQDQFLVAIRPDWTSFAGFYEFPGGKQEPGEDAYVALCREFEEEVGIVITRARHFMDREQTLPLRPLKLSFWLIEEFTGSAEACEGQQLYWLPLESLSTINFLPANEPVIAALIQEFTKNLH